LQPFADAGEVTNRPIREKGPFLALGNLQKSGLAGVGGELDQLGATGQPGGHGNAHFFPDTLADAVHVGHGRGVAPDVAVHAGEVQEALVDGSRHQGGGVFLQDAEHLL
jgi:hypothetical protein